MDLSLSLRLNENVNSFRPAAEFNFTSGTLDSRLTFTRSGSGTYIDKSTGLLNTASTDTPRFEADGLLLECSARTNLALYSRDYTNAAWVASNITPTLNQTGIDGNANSASRLTATAANGTILQSITSASSDRCYSAWVKRITGTGTIEMTVDNGVTWTAVTVTSSYTRVYKYQAAVTNPVIGFRIATSGDSIAVDYSQLENSKTPSSAILTTSTTATRNADSLTLNSLSSINYNTAALTIICEAKVQDRTTVGQTLWCISNNTTNERIYNRILGSSGWSNLQATTGGVTQFSTTPNALASDGVLFRTVTAMETNNGAHMMNNSSLGTDTSITMSTAMTNIKFGRNMLDIETAMFTLKRWLYFPFYLGDNTYLSTISSRAV